MKTYPKNGSEELQGIASVNLPEDQRKELDGITDRVQNALDKRLDEIRKLLSENKAREAKPLMDALAKEADENPMFRENEVSRFFLFREWFEECLYRHMYEPEKEIRRAQYPYDKIYAMQGSMYIDLNDLEKARECLIKALSWNPVNSRIAYLHDKKNVAIEMPYAEECRAFRQQYGFALGPDNDLLDMMYAYGKHFLDEKEKEGAAYCFSLLYELTESPEIKKILDQLGM